MPVDGQTRRPALTSALAALCEERRAQLREAGVPIDALLTAARDATGTAATGASSDAAAPSRKDAFEALCIGSDWALEWLERNPEELTALFEAGWHRSRPSSTMLREELAAILDALPAERDEQRPDGPLGAALRDFRNRHQIGIQMRDLAGAVPLEDTVGALTDLAETIIDLALERLHRRAVEAWGEPRDARGAPQHMIVLAMGKLGAGELNLSSDVDLIFAHPEPGTVTSPDGAREITAQEFFTRLGRWLIGLLDTRTPRGFVFRIDMRLRPFGDSGPLVQHTEALLDYYEEQGRDWERYALIKARPIAGDRRLGVRLIEALRPFVYRRYLDFGAIDALRQMKKLIRGEVRRRHLDDDVKLGAGGIREVEFIAQVFQLIHGGRDIRFQDRRLLVVLGRLADAGFLPGDDVAELRAAYRLLRDVEHRIQALDDQQTQRLPTDDVRLARIAWSLGFETTSAFETELAAHRARVAEHFTDLIRPVEEPGDDEAAELRPWARLWAELGAEQQQDEGGAARERSADHRERQNDGSASALKLLAETGFEDPAAALDALRRLREQRETEVTQEVGRARLDAVLPKLLQQVATLDDVRAPDAALARSLRLLDSVLRRTAYLVLLVENPGALQQLVRLVSGSEWIAVSLARHPILLDELIDVAQLYTVPTLESLRAELDELLRGVAEDDLEQQMEQLRYFKEATELRVAACEFGDILPLMKVSDALTWLAEVILERVVALAWRQTVQQFGRPCDEDGQPVEDAFGIIGYGKLGGLELGWGSDLDLVFVHDLPGSGNTDGERVVVNGQFFARLGQRIIHLLTTRTLTGELYEVDMRLRPSGNSGLLVTGLDAFTSYQRDEAWTWEHQALFRARPVVAPARVAERFDVIRREILGRERDRETLRTEIVAMRARMLAELAGVRERPDAEALAARTKLDLKQGPGAVVDIEFMVQFCALGWARAHPELLRYTDAIRTLETAQKVEILAAQDAELLITSYKEFRAEAHRKALDDQPGSTERPDLVERANRVAAVWERFMNPDA